MGNLCAFYLNAVSYLYGFISMSFSRGLLHGVYVAYAFSLFLLMMLLVAPVVLVASFFGKIRGGNFIFKVCRLWSDCWFFCVGIRQHVISESPLDPRQHCLFVANHICYLDAALIVKAIRQPMRPLGKVETSRIPLFGYIYRKAVVTVDRSSADNRARSVEILKSILRKHISIFIFPEGTFNMTGKPLKDFYDGAFRIAIETQTPIRPLLFLDSYDRMRPESVLSLNPGVSRVVFLPEVGVEQYGPGQHLELKQKVYSIMESKLRKYKASWIK
jgi:1-acyl-sn-glycerol-3-phosphate acyltransferase